MRVRSKSAAQDWWRDTGTGEHPEASLESLSHLGLGRGQQAVRGGRKGEGARERTCETEAKAGRGLVERERRGILEVGSYLPPGMA